MDNKCTETNILCFECGIRYGIECPGRLQNESTRCQICFDHFMELEMQLQSQHLNDLYVKCPWLKKLIEDKDDELLRYKTWVEDLQSGTYVTCVYCGHRYGPNENTPVSHAEVLKQHISTCPQHPMSTLKSRLRDSMVNLTYLKFQSSGTGIADMIIELFDDAVNAVQETET